jgi:hypothetical protein
MQGFFTKISIDYYQVIVIILFIYSLFDYSS